MKRAATVILIFAIFSSSLLPCASVMAAPAYSPHEDPAALDSTLDAYSFLTNYVDILGLVASGDYVNASSLLEKLQFISLPEDLQYIVSRYSNITYELIDVLSTLDGQLDEASELLDQYRLDEAAKVLENAGILVAKAKILLDDLQEATTTLSSRIGVFAASAESKVKEAYSQLQTMLQRLKELIDRYHALLSSLNDSVENIQKEELEPTVISLDLNATRVFVGESVLAFGKLTSNGQILSNRTVALLLDEKQIATTITGSDGTYSILLKVPFRYVHTMVVKVLYTPSGTDRGVYLASLSAPVSLEILFFETSLEVVAPAKAHPGLTLTVSGRVISQNKGADQRTVKLFLNDNLFAQTITDSNGLFKFQSSLSAQATVGAYRLTVSVDSKEVYAGAAHVRALNISKMASNVDVEVPPFVVLPAGVYIEGKVYSTSGPLGQATVTVNMSDFSTVVRTSDDGQFNATLNIPLSAVFVGSQDVLVEVDPVEPWQAFAKVKTNVFVVNSINFGLAVSAFVSFSFMFYVKGRKPKAQEEKKTKTATAVTLPDSNITLIEEPFKPEFKLEGTKGGILKAYLKALRAVELASGASLEPQMTLREFLHMIQPKLNDALAAFAELTALSEKALYSHQIPDITDISRAESLAVTVVEALRK